MLSIRALSILTNTSSNLLSANSCISSCLRKKGILCRSEVLLQNIRGLSSFREKKRFYQRADIEKSNGGYQVTLDERKVKTPHGNLLVLPSKQLAMAVAAEWNMQKDVVKPSNMNLTSLSNTTIDKPNPRTKEGQIKDVLEFLCTDTVCFPATEPEDLVNLQKQEWEPIITWFNRRFDVSVESFGDLLAQAIPKDTIHKLTSHLVTINDWAMTGLEFAVDTSKSFIITMALLENHINVEKAAYLSRLELEFQIGRWGSVEWTHDVDLMELRSRLAASCLFYHLCSKEDT